MLPPHPPLPLKGGGVACLPVGREGGDVTLFIAFVLKSLYTPDSLYDLVWVIPFVLFFKSIFPLTSVGCEDDSDTNKKAAIRTVLQIAARLSKTCLQKIFKYIFWTL
jgi:hypothetical protein